MDRGELVSDDLMIGIVARAAAAGRLRGGLRARRLSAHGAAGRGARPACRAATRAARRRRHRGAARRSWCGGSRAGAGARRAATDHVVDDPPERRGLRDVRRARWCSARDDSDAVVRERLKVYCARDAAARRVLPDAADVPVGRRRAAARRGGGGPGRGDRRRRGDGEAERAVIVCRSAAELERMRAAERAGRRGADRARGGGRAGRDDGGPRRAGRAADARRRARRRRSRATTGTRRRFARRSTRRWSTGFRRRRGC